MKKETKLNVIIALIAALFFYAATSKLMDYEKSRGQMLNQVFPIPIAEVLVWLIPAIELILVFLLLLPATRKKALWASFGLLSLFTLYIAVVMTGIFGRVPCSCGGILSHMSYGVHLIFNLVFVALALWGLGIMSNWNINYKWFNFFKGRKEELRQGA